MQKNIITYPNLSLKNYDKSIPKVAADIWLNNLLTELNWVERNPWNPTLIEIKNSIEAITSEKYNSVLANYYRDGNDSMGWHSDDESMLKKNSAIASLSLGQNRPLFFKHKNQAISFNIDQSHGSVIVMHGETQKYWKHSIKKSKKSMLPRLNLTFRTIITP